MSLHTGCCQGAHKPSSCTTFMFNPHGGRAATGKKHLTSSMQGRFGPVRLFAPSLWTVACQASLSGRGFSRQEYWSLLPVLVAIPSRALFPAARAASPSEDLVLPEPL